MAVIGVQRALGLAAATVIVAMASGVAPAAAAELGGAGWWTASPLPVAPEADDERLFVQGSPDPDSPLAFAAVEFSLEPGEEPVALTLTVAAASASTPTTELMACPLVDTFEPASGAPMDDAPEYDCDTSVTAVADETTYTLPVGGLEEEGRLALAILPTLPKDRVVLEVPDETALRTLTFGAPAAGSPGEVVAPPAADPPSGPPAADGFAGDEGGGVGPAPVEPPATGSAPAPDFGSLPDPVPDLPAAPEEAAAEEPASDDEVALGPREDLAAAALPLPGDDSGASPLAVLAFVVLAAGAAALWLTAGRRDPAEAEESPPAQIASA